MKNVFKLYYEVHEAMKVLEQHFSERQELELATVTGIISRDNCVKSTVRYTIRGKQYYVDMFFYPIYTVSPYSCIKYLADCIERSELNEIHS